MNCAKCGSEVIPTTGANYHCPKCGFSVNDLLYRGDPTPFTPAFTPPIDIDPPTFGSGSTGWICPKCGRGVSPYTTVCPCYHQSCGIPEITCDTLQSVVSNINKSLNCDGCINND